MTPPLPQAQVSGIKLEVERALRPETLRVSVPLEELHGALVLLSCLASGKGAEVTLASSFWVFLPRIEAVLTGAEFSNHGFGQARTLPGRSADRVRQD